MDITKLASTPEQAKARGDLYFFTGKPCRNGHLAPRYAKTTPNCVQCSREAYLRRRDKTLAELKAAYHADTEGYRTREKERNRQNPKRYWAKNAYKNAKKRAEKQGVSFTITRHDIEILATDRCPVFNTPFLYYGRGKSHKESPTLDRLVPSLGYIPGNVVVVSRKANEIKSAYTAQDIRQVAEWLESHGY